MRSSTWYAVLSQAHGLFDDLDRLYHLVTEWISHNNVVESTLQGADIPGFMEVNFALSDFVAVAFALHIHSFQEQQFYAFARKGVFDVITYSSRIGNPLDRALRTF